MRGCAAPFRLSLSGGSTPRAAYQLLAQRNDLAWDCAELFFGDERFVPPDHPDSNYRMVRETLLAGGNGPAARAAGHAHRRHAAKAPPTRYDEILRQQYGACDPRSRRAAVRSDAAGPGRRRPYRLAASPASRCWKSATRWVAAVPQGRDEVRASRSPIRRWNPAELILFLVAGADKRDALAQVRAGDARLPAGGLKPQGEVFWLVDRAAAGGRPGYGSEPCAHRRLCHDRRLPHARRWSAATARSTGSACRASIPTPVSPPFWATKNNGRWLIAPAAKTFTRQTARRYRGDSLILETLFTTATGKARLIDFMPPGTPTTAPSCASSKASAGPCRHAHRTGDPLRLWHHHSLGAPASTARTMTAVAGPHLLTFRTRAELHGENMHSVADFTVKKGDARCPLCWLWPVASRRCRSPSMPIIALEETEKLLARLGCHLPGQGQMAQAAIMRSLLTLKGLSYAPTGGIVAAVTTSLPEKIGGTRNWDYRYCWLRDATFTLLAFLNAGYTEEAKVWQDWLMRVIAGAPEQLQTMYSVMGEKRLDEIELPHLAGYENSRPVRIGNAAAHPAAARYLWRTGRCDGPGAQGRTAGRRRSGEEIRAGLPGASGKDLEPAG